MNIDFLSEQKLIFTSKKYENIYILLNSKYDIKYHDLFTLCAAIGFRNDEKEKLDGKGREFRSNYLSREQKATCYSIVLSDNELGRRIDEFQDAEYVLKARKRLEEYAEGGMKILVRDVFKSRFTEDGNVLDEGYDEYDVDIISYYVYNFQEVPF